MRNKSPQMAKRMKHFLAKGMGSDLTDAYFAQKGQSCSTMLGENGAGISGGQRQRRDV